MSRMTLGASMTRITISINAEVEAKLKEIQQHLSLIDEKPQSMSKVINMVLVAGIIGSSKLSAYEWVIIKSFTQGKRIELKTTVGEEYRLNILAQSY